MHGPLSHIRVVIVRHLPSARTDNTRPRQTKTDAVRVSCAQRRSGIVLLADRLSLLFLVRRRVPRHCGSMENEEEIIGRSCSISADEEQKQASCQKHCNLPALSPRRHTRKQVRYLYVRAAFTLDSDVLATKS